MRTCVRADVTVRLLAQEPNGNVTDRQVSARLRTFPRPVPCAFYLFIRAPQT